MRYTPFKRELEELTGADILGLRDVSEGWHVEYKSEQIQTKAFAKSLSAFANHHGGWLIIGVAERDGRAESFPGVDCASVPALEESLRNASADCLNPHVQYSHVVLRGPIDEIGVPAEKAIVVVRIPAGAEPPYVHNDGKIYRRIADSSNPKPETDRAVLDALWKQGRRRRKKMIRLLTDVPLVSKAEKTTPFMHVLISPDPFEVSGYKYRHEFDQFRRIMEEKDMPFDNFFSCSDGHVGRQVFRNNARERVLTWDQLTPGHARVTMPLRTVSRNLETYLGSYKYFARFMERFSRDYKISEAPRVLDANLIFGALCVITARFRKLMSEFGQTGPFHMKTLVENTWRVVPYLDCLSYVESVERNGVPIVQADRHLVPDGSSSDSFTVLSRGACADPVEQQVKDSIEHAILIFQALGIPFHVLRNAEADIGYLAERSRIAQAGQR